LPLTTLVEVMVFVENSVEVTVFVAPAAERGPTR